MRRPSQQYSGTNPNRREHIMQRIPVYVVIPPRLLLLDVAGPLEVLRRANLVQAAVHFDVHYIGPSPSLRTSISLTVTGIEPLPERLPESAWVVLAGDVDEVMTSEAPTEPERPKSDFLNEEAIVRWL